MTQTSSYIPGMCNINQAEVAMRKKAMWLGIGLSVGLFIVLLLFSFPVMARLVLLLPVYMAAIGYLQVKNKFCVAYGATGRQHADETNTAVVAIADQAALIADRAKTRKLNLQAAVITIVVVAVILLIPSIPF